MIWPVDDRWEWFSRGVSSGGALSGRDFAAGVNWTVICPGVISLPPGWFVLWVTVPPSSRPQHSGAGEARRRLQPGGDTAAVHAAQVRHPHGVEPPGGDRDGPQRVHGRDEANEAPADGRGTWGGGGGG